MQVLEFEPFYQFFPVAWISSKILAEKRFVKLLKPPSILFRLLGFPKKFKIHWKNETSIIWNGIFRTNPDLSTTVVTNLEYKASSPALLVTWHSTISRLKGPNFASRSLLYSKIHSEDGAKVELNRTCEELQNRVFAIVLFCSVANSNDEISGFFCHSDFMRNQFWRM